MAMTAWSSVRRAVNPRNPAWFADLVADPVVTVEAEAAAFLLHASVAEGVELRDALWDRHLVEHRQFGEYPSKTDRIIPIARLTRVG